MAHHLLGCGGVGAQVVDHHLNGHRVVIGVPAVVVGDHRQGAVGDFGFAGQAGFGVVGHADHIAAPAAVELRFRLGGEGRALHAEVGATAVQAATLRQHGLHRVA